MDLVLRATAFYLMLLLIVRLAGKRSLAEVTTMDFLLLLIIGETADQVILDDDHSLTGALVVILTLLCVDTVFALVKRSFPGLGRVLEGVPVIVMRRGKPVEEAMRNELIDEEDIVNSAREAHGLGALEDVDYAVLENHGKIGVIPKK